MAADPDPDPTPGAEPTPEVLGDDRTERGFDPLGHLVEVARTTLAAEGVTTGRLDLVVVERDEMEALNLAHMGHEGPTDVLSFPLDSEDLLDGLEAGMPWGAGEPLPLHLGDVVLCPEVARRQAAEHAGTVDAEYALLVIHGVLHILGHDHAEVGERARMVDRERHHLARLGHPHPDDRARPDDPQVGSAVSS